MIPPLNPGGPSAVLEKSHPDLHAFRRSTYQAPPPHMDPPTLSARAFTISVRPGGPFRIPNSEFPSGMPVHHRDLATDLEGHLERLLIVEAGVDLRLVGAVEVDLRQTAGATDALGDVVP